MATEDTGEPDPSREADTSASLAAAHPGASQGLVRPPLGPAQTDDEVLPCDAPTFVPTADALPTPPGRGPAREVATFTALDPPRSDGPLHVGGVAPCEAPTLPGPAHPLGVPADPPAPPWQMAHDATELDLMRDVPTEPGTGALEPDADAAATLRDTPLPGQGDEQEGCGLPSQLSAAERYVIGEELGRGGMGVVYRAFDQNLQRDVAMKVLNLGARTTREHIARFIDEARTTSQLQHPGIVSVHEVGRDAAGRLFFTMKLVQGRTLSQVVRDLRAHDAAICADFSRFRLLEIFVEVCRIVHYAHERGVVHRDLKPQNIMVGRYGEVQVMDWGLVKVLAADASAPRAPQAEAPLASGHAETQCGALLGTPGYMAPEQAAPETAKATPRADIYALGAVLYHLLTGNAPYGGRTPVEIVTRLLTVEPPPPRTLESTTARELEAVCLQALARSPEDRYASAAELAGEVQAYLEGRPVQALPLGHLGRALKFCRRNPLKATLVLLLCLTAAGMTVLARIAWDRTLEARAALGVSEGLRQEKEADYHRLADLAMRPVMADLLGAARRDPKQVGAFVAQADTLLSRLVRHEQTLARLGAPAEGEDPRSTVQRASLLELLPWLQVLRAQRDELLVCWALADTTRARDAALWREALRSLADTALCPQYQGLQIAPQGDLLPIGRDPGSGLWEFWHRWSGEPPVRTQDGSLQLSEATGLIFVLIPGGSFAMGSERYPQYSDEGPVRTVAVPPFFISKLEMTQGQWQRMDGENPAWWVNERFGVDFFSALHPVESVSWNACTQLLGQFALSLPSETQWERAARAGTTSRWYTGDDERQALAAANLSGEQVDGWRYTAAVGRFAPNAFGLHDTMGNVWEWCLDSYDGTEGSGRVIRGASFTEAAEFARHAYRNNLLPALGDNNLGLRPVRAAR